MTGPLPDTIEVDKTIPAHVDANAGLGGSSYVDEQGRWVVQLSVHDDNGGRHLSVVEGDRFEFAGQTWEVTKVYEPTTADRGRVASLTRLP